MYVNKNALVELITSIKNNTQRSIDVTYLKYTKAKMPSMIPMVAQRELILDEASTIQLADAIKDNTSLRYISFGNIEIDNKCAQILLEAFKENKTITSPVHYGYFHKISPNLINEINKTLKNNQEELDKTAPGIVDKLGRKEPLLPEEDSFYQKRKICIDNILKDKRRTDKLNALADSLIEAIKSNHVISKECYNELISNYSDLPLALFKKTDGELTQDLPKKIQEYERITFGSLASNLLKTIKNNGIISDEVFDYLDFVKIEESDDRKEIKISYAKKRFYKQAVNSLLLMLKDEDNQTCHEMIDSAMRKYCENKGTTLPYDPTIFSSFHPLNSIKNEVFPGFMATESMLSSEWAEITFERTVTKERDEELRELYFEAPDKNVGSFVKEATTRATALAPDARKENSWVERTGARDPHPQKERCCSIQ